MDVIFIDPYSTEVVRAGYYYDMYFAAALYPDAIMLEGWGVEDLNTFDMTDTTAHWIISLWSYPQIDFCQWAMMNLKGKVSFVGYEPLIKQIGGEVFEFDKVKGMSDYVSCYDEWMNISAYDCDMHLKKLDNGRPTNSLFLGYGCVYDCSFCPYAVQTENKIIKVPIDQSIENVRHLGAQGNIHFFDENFFIKPKSYLDRLYAEAFDGSFKWIVLTSAKELRKEIERVGEDFLIEKGLALAEVGYESSDDNLRADMRKRDSENDLVFLANSKINIFWLTITFYPGETIETIYNSGQFLKQYGGYKTEEMLNRIATNSTIYGLGQFTQPYTGTDIGGAGVMICHHPIRLVPSFLPDSFLNEIPYIVTDERPPEFYEMMEIYNLSGFDESIFTDDKTVRQIIVPNPQKYSVYVALCARFGIIKSNGQRQDKTEFTTYVWDY